MLSLGSLIASIGVKYRLFTFFIKRFYRYCIPKMAKKDTLNVPHIRERINSGFFWCCNTPQNILRAL